MQGVNPLTQLCVYSTPCGWCCKWDKECNRQMECRRPKNKDLDNIKAGKGLTLADVYPTLDSGIERD